MAKYEKWLEKENLVLLEGWARDGLTDEQIAQNIGITPKTLYEWKNKYSEISESLKKGKEVSDYQVENALFNKALGGDTTAQIFWLKNRKPHKWRDKPVEDTAEQLGKINENIESLATLLNNPSPDRKIEDE